MADEPKVYEWLSVGNYWVLLCNGENVGMTLTQSGPIPDEVVIDLLSKMTAGLNGDSS